MKKIISLILVFVLALSMLTACGADEPVGSGASELYDLRSGMREGKEIHYVKMSVKHYGSIILLLERDNAPKTVDNFLKLVNQGFYDGLTFHRIVPDFMIQGGDPEANGSGGLDEKIYGEFVSNYYFNTISHLRGTISMARGNDPDSASCQFFICNGDSTFLNGNYASFGYVIAGLSVVDAITSGTVEYTDHSEANGKGGTIANKAKQAKIQRAYEISEAEALEYVSGTRK